MGSHQRFRDHDIYYVLSVSHRLSFAFVISMHYSAFNSEMIVPSLAPLLCYFHMFGNPLEPIFSLSFSRLASIL
jgi:hypothetical protein